MPAIPPIPVPEAFAQAVQHHQAGRLAEAETLYRRILAVDPNHAPSWHYLGVIAHQHGRHDLAVEWMRRAIGLHAGDAAVHCNLGGALSSLGRFDEAMASYREALRLRPTHAAAHNNLGTVLARQGLYAEALEAYRRAIELQPDYPEAHINLGDALLQHGQLADAVTIYRRALMLRPEAGETSNNLGNALHRLGQFGEAEAAYRCALASRPGYAEAQGNLGLALAGQGRFDEAVAACHQALALKPDFAEASNNLGLALAARGQFDEALAAYRRALQLHPHYAAAHNNLGNAFSELGRLDEAVDAYNRALEIQPDDAKTNANLGGTFTELGLLEEAIAAYRRALDLQPDNPGVHSNVILALHYQPGENEEKIAEEQRRWNRQFSDPVRAFIRPHTNERTPVRRLRIGYVSPDLRDHVVCRNVLPLFRCHDRRNFEILCYADVAKPDAITEAIREYADHWRSIDGLGDESLAEMIRTDAVDVLVDLSQHTAGNRLSLFARQPAPVQVSFAGYPASPGVEAIPYRISDRYLESGIADAVSDFQHSQTFLIDSFWCFDPCGMEVEVNALPALEAGHVAFGSLNKFCKVNDPLLRLWARVLRQIERSRLILLGNPNSRAWHIREVLEREGVAPQRVEFVEPRPRRDYLELYHRLDIVLDTFPYNGHTSSLDALWMGVPVVSLAGRPSVSRGGYSQLSNLRLPELAAFSEDEFTDIATRLSRDLPRLSELRRTLRPRMQASPLLDAPHFARQIEAAYRAMWRLCCENQSPTSSTPSGLGTPPP